MAEGTGLDAGASASVEEPGSSAFDLVPSAFDPTSDGAAEPSAGASDFGAGAGGSGGDRSFAPSVRRKKMQCEKH